MSDNATNRELAGLCRGRLFVVRAFINTCPSRYRDWDGHHLVLVGAKTARRTAGQSPQEMFGE